MASMSDGLLTRVVNCKTTAQVWSVLGIYFASQTIAKVHLVDIFNKTFIVVVSMVDAVLEGFLEWKQAILQLCGKMGHLVSDDISGTGSNHMSTMLATPEVNIDASWYSDSETTNHLTTDINNLMDRTDFFGYD